MNTPLCNLEITKASADAVYNQILSGGIGPGRVNDLFSKTIAEYVNSPWCLLTTSGTVALSVAAKALDLQPGDEIIVPAYGVISTINAFTVLGLKPRLADIKISTGCIDPNKLLEIINEKTKAVCFVNFSGYTGPDLKKIKSICDSYNIPLIEDAACALGQKFDETFAGNFGTIGIYSFSVPKIITTGQGGAILFQDEPSYLKAKAYIDQGDTNWRQTNLNRGIGSNLRMPDILASFGLEQLKDLEHRLSIRRKIYQRFQERMEKFIYSIPSSEPPLHNIVFTREPDYLVEFLKTNNIQAARQYRTISQHPIYKNLAEKEFENSDFWENHAVYLPFGIGLTLEQVDEMIQTVLVKKEKLIPTDSLMLSADIT